MKKLFIFIFILALISLYTINAISQTRAPIRTNYYWNYLTTASGGILFDNDPSSAETSKVIYPSGYILASLVYTVADTCRDTIFVDFSSDNSTWTTIATKAINCTDVNSPVYYEEVLRDGDSDLIDGVTGMLRVRNHRAATNNGTAGSYPRIYVKFCWVP